MAKYILIGEDDKFFGKLLKSKLESAGFEVGVADNGQKVLDQAKAKRPDLILLDLIMPVKDGFETLKALKEDPDLKSIKVFISSSLSQKEDLAKTKQLGANGYVNKEDMQNIVSDVQKAFS